MSCFCIQQFQLVKISNLDFIYNLICKSFTFDQIQIFDISFIEDCLDLGHCTQNTKKPFAISLLFTALHLLTAQQAHRLFHLPLVQLLLFHLRGFLQNNKMSSRAYKEWKQALTKPQILAGPAKVSTEYFFFFYVVECLGFYKKY